MKLSAKIRPIGTKNEVKRIRKEGLIPSVLYAKGKETLSITIEAKPFVQMLQKLPKGTLSTKRFEIEIDGQVVEALLKDIQYKATNYEVIHLDFEQLQQDSKVRLNIPVRFLGESDCVGVKLGGVIRPVMRSIRIECLPSDIPNEFGLDIRELKIGGSKRVSQIEVEQKVRLLTPKEEVVVVVVKR